MANPRPPVTSTKEVGRSTWFQWAEIVGRMQAQIYRRSWVLVVALASAAFLVAMVGCSSGIPLAAATHSRTAHSAAGQSSTNNPIEIQLEVPAFSSEPTFSVSASARGHSAIVEMKLYLDGVLSARTGWGELSTVVQADPGDHNLTLRVADSGGHAAEKSARVTVADPEPRGRFSRISFNPTR